MEKKPQIESEFENHKASAARALLNAVGANVTGTRGAFNAVGNGAEMQAENADINAGLGAGNPNLPALQSPLIGGGTDSAYNAQSGGKIKLSGARVNAGAFSGGAALRNLAAGHAREQQPLKGGRTVGYGDAPGPHPNKNLEESDFEGPWLQQDGFQIDQSGMDPARLEAIRARALAKHKNLTTTSTAETFHATESKALATNVRSTSPCTKNIPAVSLEEVQYLTQRLFELVNERDDYKQGKEQADSLVDTYRTQVKNWEKKLREKDEELHSLRSQVENSSEMLCRKVAETEDLCYPMFQSGFDEAVMQMKHFNPDVTLDDSRLNRDVSLKTMIERGEA